VVQVPTSEAGTPCRGATLDGERDAFATMTLDEILDTGTLPGPTVTAPRDRYLLG
jgi:hypothetical protein